MLGIRKNNIFIVVGMEEDCFTAEWQLKCIFSHFNEDSGMLNVQRVKEIKEIKKP
jgi:hypothetical protein